MSWRSCPLRSCGNSWSHRMGIETVRFYNLQRDNDLGISSDVQSHWAFLNPFACNKPSDSILALSVLSWPTFSNHFRDCKLFRILCDLWNINVPRAMEQNDYKNGWRITLFLYFPYMIYKILWIYYNQSLNPE